VVHTLEDLKAIVAAGSGQHFVFESGSIVLNVKDFKDLNDVVNFFKGLPSAARQMGATVRRDGS